MYIARCCSIAASFRLRSSSAALTASSRSFFFTSTAEPATSITDSSSFPNGPNSSENKRRSCLNALDVLSDS